MKTFMDPVHGPITVDDELLLALLETPALQRLRRIRQLGGAFTTYHGAEHSRFGHALGSLHVMGRVLDRLQARGAGLDPESRRAALAAALLHDVGHGPFSHALEGVLTPGTAHEEWARRILLDPGGGGVPEAFAACGPGLRRRVWAILSRREEAFPWLADLLASELDVDRMDYLLRDALYTGATYGRFDLERILATMGLHEGRLVLAYKGLHAAEQYVLSRYFMYWQVYLHKTSRAQELVLRGAWLRAAELARAGRLPVETAPAALRPFLLGEPTVADYLACDDYDVVAALKTWASHADPILADLCRRFLDRRLLKPLALNGGTTGGAEPDPERLAAARAAVARRGWEPAYYFLVDRPAKTAYDYYREDAGSGRAIHVLLRGGQVREISRVSPAIGALAGQRHAVTYVYVPAPCREAVEAILCR